MQERQMEVVRATLSSGSNPQVRTGLVERTGERIHVDLSVLRVPRVNEEGMVEFTEPSSWKMLWPAPGEAVVLVDPFTREGEERRRAAYWCTAAEYDAACAAAAPKIQ